MPRHARTVIPGVPHHITQRGNRKERVFFEDTDYVLFLDLLSKYSKQNALKIASFCLMPNHTHLIAIPESEESMHRTLKPVHMQYSQYLNKRRASVGINWQGRYFSSPMDDTYTWTAFQYLSLNPVRAKIVTRPEDYRWSSASTHLLDLRHPLLTVERKWLEMGHNAVKEISFGTTPEKFDVLSEA